VAMTLSTYREKLPVPILTGTQTVGKPTPEVPMHPGARAYFAGDPLPESGEESRDQ
jgi:hypothetical protein